MKTSESYSYNGRRRPKMGSGMAEKAAKTVEGRKGRMKQRIGKLPKNQW